jgi:hypothetical protein
MGLVQIMGLDHKDQTDRDQIMDREHKDQTDLVHRDQTKTGLVQIMMLDLRDLVKMDLDLKMETTHKKKTSKLRGLFFIKLPSTLAIIF